MSTEEGAWAEFMSGIWNSLSTFVAAAGLASFRKGSRRGARRTCSRRFARDMLPSLDVFPVEKYSGPGSVALYEATADCVAWYLTMTSPDC